MNELFGIPMDTLVVVLAVLVAVALGALGALAVRNRVLFKLGVRNVRRRRGRTALIVVGLMLGTTIIAAALTTGDTMSHTIRSTATKALGETDEVVSAKGAAEDISGELGQATGTGYFDAQVVERIESALGSGLTDGVTGGIIEDVALQAPVTRQTEPTRHPLRPRSVAHEGLCPDSRRRRRRGHARRSWPARGLSQRPGRRRAARANGRSG